MKSISYIIVIFIGLSLCNAFGEVKYLPVDESTNYAFGKLPLYFVENQGQHNEEVIYYAKSEGITVYCTDTGLVFGFTKGSLKLKFSEDRRVKPEARSELEGKVNYFIGNNPELWHTNIPTYSEIVYHEVYNGIDLVYSGNQRRLKYTFYIQPNTETNQIQMIYEGIEEISIDEDTGELVILTMWGEIRDTKPVAHQDIEGIRKEVDVSFTRIDKNRVGFELGSYNPKYTLVIDPGYSTYLGGSDADEGYGIAVDSNGNAYVIGITYSSNFPTLNPYQESKAGGEIDVFVTKIESGGSTLIYSTYLGGTGNDTGNDIAIDSSGNAYVTGYTYSSDYPTQNPYDSSLDGERDTFVTKLSSSGDTIIYSTYLGGSNWDDGFGITADSNGNAYVTGYTYSSNFPTQNPYDGSLGGSRDAFITKLSNSGNTLIYSTYLGGSSNDDGFDIAVDSNGNAYITGSTFSSDFPTLNPYDNSLGGNRDAFVTKLNSNGDTLIYSTYLGGNSNRDWGNSIAVDGNGNAYVIGLTTSSDYPTKNPYDNSLGGEQDAFITQLSNSGSTITYSTYLGGSDDDYGNSIAVYSNGNVYVTGVTTSSDFPTHNPYDSSLDGERDAFVTNLSSSGSTLVYSTYLGGSSNDYTEQGCIAIDSNGNAYVTGRTGSSDFPTLYPYQNNSAGATDAFIASFLSDGSLPVILSTFTATTSVDSIVLRWRTESEVNNIGFNIYRSTKEDSNYNEITFIEGAGNSAISIDYQFTDTNVEAGETYFYYIEDIDISGDRSKSEIVKVIVPIIKVVVPPTKIEPIPKESKLLQNYPNPFNPETYIPFQLAQDVPVTISIYNAKGNLIRTLDIGNKQAGIYTTKDRACYWDGTDRLGQKVSSGLYYYTLLAGEYRATKRMIVVK